VSGAGTTLGTRTRRPGTALVGLWALALALCAAAVWARGIEAPARAAPLEAGPGRPRIQAPMQFLSAGARERVAELDPFVDEEWGAIWRATREVVFHLEGCPRLLQWMQGTEGLRAERLLLGLRSGSEEDALAALALVFELARGTDWAPGLRGQAEHAEKLGAMLQAWLEAWGERGVEDALLQEPALAAGLVYGAVMRIAWRAPMVGHNEAPHARALAFLDGLCGLGARARAAYGRALQARYPRAWAVLEGREDRLRGLMEEAALLFPDVQGDCSR
jgi:hypothetical protein